MKWLRFKKVETGSLLCLGCGHENNCGIHGCAVMRAAADAMENLQTENAALRRVVDNILNEQDMMIKEFTAKLEELAEVKAERDAAIEDWRGFCVKCAWNGKQRLSDGEMDARCATCRANNKCNWEWRGPQKEA